MTTIACLLSVASILLCSPIFPEIGGNWRKLAEIGCAELAVVSSTTKRTFLEQLNLFHSNFVVEFGNNFIGNNTSVNTIFSRAMQSLEATDY